MTRHSVPKRSTLTSLTGAALLLAATPAAAQEPAEAGEAQTPKGVVVTAKPGKGVVFEQEGDYRLRLRGRFQVLETLSEADGDLSTDLYIRRARLAMDGYVWDEDITYKMELAFAPRDLDETGSPVLDAYLELQQLRDLQLRIGMYKIPFDRQRVISSGDLQLVDRSPLIAEMTLDRDIGFTLHSDDLFGNDGRFGYWLGFYGGDGRGRVEAPAGFLYLARAEYRPFGAFEDYVEADLDRSADPRLALGASIAWNQNAIRTNSNRGSAFREEFSTLEGFEGFDYLHLEADAIFKWSGLSVLSQFIWRDERGDGAFTGEAGGETVVVDPRNGWGWFVQAGQMIGPHWEIAARYTEQHTLDGASLDLRESLAEAGRELGGGVSWYLHGHQLKVQADYFRLWGTEVDGLDAIAFEDGANQVRLQLQAAW
ncbi:porin [Vulgatibacter sp.]|uniref:porin n=1 Tax=Vulgatibacter sp. TaxID=1971226 RepID=UPI003564101C